MQCVHILNWSKEHPNFERVIELDNLIEHSWTSAQWQELATEMSLFLCEKEGVVGFALYRISKLEGLAHLLKIVIDQSRQGSGIAREFWLAQLPTLRDLGCDRVYLEVAKNNLRAIGFYQSIGFQLLHEVKGFYSDGQNALTMELVI